MSSKTLICLYKEHAADLPVTISFADHYTFDAVITPIVSPLFHREFVHEEIANRHLAFSRSDLILEPNIWLHKVVAKFSDYIDCDSDDDNIRKHSEMTLKQEMAYAQHLAQHGYSLIQLKGTNSLNLARIVAENVQGKQNIFFLLRLNVHNFSCFGDFRNNVN